MVTNIHGFGASLQNALRADVVGHSVSLERKDGATVVTVGPFGASSPPIGHQLMDETGLDISLHERDFYFQKDLTGSLGEPRIGDVVIDHEDDTRWRILPQGGEYAWNWHGQNKTAYKILTKQD